VVADGWQMAAVSSNYIKIGQAYDSPQILKFL
jgi:hypothetical protein